MNERVMKHLDKRIAEALAIEVETAKEAGTIGYMPIFLVQATMPHSQCDEYVFRRTNGSFRLTMMADPDIGLPYGSKPRLLMAWVTSSVW